MAKTPLPSFIWRCVQAFVRRKKYAIWFDDSQLYDHVAYVAFASQFDQMKRQDFLCATFQKGKKKNIHRFKYWLCKLNRTNSIWPVAFVDIFAVCGQKTLRLWSESRKCKNKRQIRPNTEKDKDGMRSISKEMKRLIDMCNCNVTKSYKYSRTFALSSPTTIVKRMANIKRSEKKSVDRNQHEPTIYARKQTHMHTTHKGNKNATLGGRWAALYGKPNGILVKRIHLCMTRWGDKRRETGHKKKTQTSSKEIILYYE